MHAIKTPSFLRPSSRPSSPLPTSPAPVSRADTQATLVERTPRPLTRLTLTSFRKSGSPAPVSHSAPSTPVGNTLIQDGSYLEALGLKLSEAVSKALAQPANVGTTANGDLLNGKRPIPAGRGRALGALIAAELNASQGNHHLQRAIMRQLQRPLSVLLTGISANLLPLLSSPAFLNPLAPTVQAPNPNPTQLHALALVNFAGELLESFDRLDPEICNDARGDGLKSTREGLSSFIGRVINPLINGIKNEITPVIQSLETPNPAWASSASPANGATAPKGPASAKVSANIHPSIITLQSLMPIYAKALARYTGPSCCQTTLATFLVSVLWNSLIALSHRSSPPRPRASSFNTASAAAPPPVTASSTGTWKKIIGSSTTPPTTPPSARFTIKLPPSRPPSPPGVSVPSTASDARVLFDLLSLMPRPSQGTEANRTAYEAVEEAFEGLAALTALLGAITEDTRTSCTNASQAEVREDLDLELLTTGLPVLIALPVLLRWAGYGEPQDMMPEMLGLSKSEYRDGCLSGFGRADECTDLVGRRVLGILKVHPNKGDTKTKMVIKWLEVTLENEN